MKLLTGGSLFALVIGVLLAMSCSENALPEAPAFEELGFADALPVVHKQVLIAYQQWQEKPLDAARNGRLGMLLSTYGKYAGSEAFFLRAKSLAPGEFRWPYYLATSLQQLGRYEEAVSMLREALSLDPSHTDSRIQLAGLLLQLNAIEESLALYQEITSEYPKRVEGWLGLGKALDRAGDLAGATRALQRARIFGPEYGEVHYALAAVLNAGGDEEGAASELAKYKNTAHNTIHSSDPLILEVIRLNASDGPHMSKADYQLRRRQYEQAAASFRTALVINPANQDAWGGLIDAQARLGEQEQTGDSYRAALAAGINYKRLHFIYGQALQKWQQFDLARDVMGKAIELDPLYTDALIAMGELELQQGASAAAAEQFRRARLTAPNDRQIQFSLAQALNAAGQFQEAADQLEPLTTDPALNRAVTLKELAIAYHGLQRKDDAIKALQDARESATNAFNKPLIKAIDELLGTW